MEILACFGEVSVTVESHAARFGIVGGLGGCGRSWAQLRV